MSVDAKLKPSRYLAGGRGREKSSDHRDLARKTINATTKKKNKQMKGRREEGSPGSITP